MKKKKIRISTVLLLVLLFVLFCVVAWAGWKLYRYYADYSKDRDLYSDLRDEVIKSEEKENEADEINQEVEFEITNPEELVNDEQMKLNFENPETGDEA